jgi:2-C-methyl-D-erythritol 4-phosphate cytidylyltransferase
VSRRTVVLVPAGGAGRRLGGVVKPLLELAGEPLLRHTLRPFLEVADVIAVVVALPAAEAARPPAWLGALDPRVIVVAGGAERSDSVRLALAAAPAAADIVLVHDAARPLLTRALVERCIDAAAAGTSVIAAVPVTDTIKEVAADGRVLGTPDRRALFHAQTPQAFPRQLLAAAHARAAADGFRATDDAALVARYGGTIEIVEGELENLKVTHGVDVAVAEMLLQRRRVAAP